MNLGSWLISQTVNQEIGFADDCPMKRLRIARAGRPVTARVSSVTSSVAVRNSRKRHGKATSDRSRRMTIIPQRKFSGGLRGCETCLSPNIVLADSHGFGQKLTDTSE